MDFQPFSLNNNTKRFPGFEFIAVVLLLATIYSIGTLLLPTVFESVEQKVLRTNELQLVKIVKQSVIVDYLNEDESRTYSLQDLLNDDIIKRSENESFLHRYALESSVTVIKNDGVYTFNVFLIDSSL